MSARLISSQNLPILENGDRVTREEFERRYHRMPNVKKAELFEKSFFPWVVVGCASIVSGRNGTGAIRAKLRNQFLRA